MEVELAVGSGNIALLHVDWTLSIEHFIAMNLLEGMRSKERRKRFHVFESVPFYYPHYLYEICHSRNESTPAFLTVANLLWDWQLQTARRDLRSPTTID